MDVIKDCNDPPEDYWNELGGPSDKNTPSKRLINGISMKDLCDGKEVMFEISKNGDEYDFEDKEVSEYIVSHDSRTMREKRGAPHLNTSFEELSSNMTNVTDDGFVKKQGAAKIVNRFKESRKSNNIMTLTDKKGSKKKEGFLIITCGTSKIVPECAYVTIHYNLYKESSELPFDSTYMRNRPLKFRLGQGEVILGLEYAIKSMKKNENSMFFIKWEVAFGAMGCPDRIGPECDIVADVTLINFVEADPEYDLILANQSEKTEFLKFINEVKQLVYNGSEEFAKGDTKSAVHCYRKALRILNSLRLANQEEEDQMLKRKVKCLVNLAVCFNKLGKPEESCIACQEALSIDKKNVKANFHYGRASIALSNFQMAKQFLLRADKLKPNDKEINMELKKLNDKKALYKLRDKKFWMKAFEGEEKAKTPEEEIPSLKSFEENLKTALEESTKNEKPYILSLPLLDEEMKVCDKIAADMKMKLETQKNVCLFKTPKSQQTTE